MPRTKKDTRALEPAWAVQRLLCKLDAHARGARALPSDRSMFFRSASTAVILSLSMCAAVACSDSGDDGCVGCEPSMGGTLPPSVPTGGGPEPTGGDTSTGGFSGDSAGGLGGTATGGLGGVLGTGGTGALGAEGGSAGTGAFGAEGGSAGTGAFGAEGDSAGTGAFGAEGGTLTTGGAFGTGGVGGAL